MFKRDPTFEYGSNNTVSPQSPPLDSEAHHLCTPNWEVRPPRPAELPFLQPPPGPTGLTSPRPRSPTARPRAEVRFPAGSPEGSEPIRAPPSRNPYRVRRSGDLMGSDGPRSGARRTATEKPRPTHPRLAGAGQSLITAARSARPGGTVSAGPGCGHAQSGAEPRPVPADPRGRLFAGAAGLAGAAGGEGTVRAGWERRDHLGTLSSSLSAALRR